MDNTAHTPIKLGLIGDNIAASQAPRLHRLAGQLTGLPVTYDRLVPAELGLDAQGILAKVRKDGYRGVNVTYPYKEQLAQCVTVADPLVRAIGAVNTVVFDRRRPQGFNTDYTGFIRAYRGQRGAKPPGTVCLIGTGGVGKAVAFGLMALGATCIRCTDLNAGSATALAEALRALGMQTTIQTYDQAEEAAQGADGVINCTPLGMSGIGGTPLPAPAMQGASWAFDAVYTPVDTVFLQTAKQARLEVISGYELFFGQGVEAWDIFTSAPLDHRALRAALARP